MINHGRTLLLNEKGPRTENPAIPGDEFVPAYSPLKLSGTLFDIYRILFGSKPDYRGKVYRLAQYMSILHSTEFVDVMLNLDHRFTYRLGNADIFEADYGAVISTTGVDTANILGEWDGNPELGRVRTVWRIEATSGTSVEVTNVTDDVTIARAVTFNKGTSSRVPLVGSSLEVTFTTKTDTAESDPSLSSGEPEETVRNHLIEGDTWTITLDFRLEKDVGEILAELLSAKDLVKNELFGQPLSEPYKTLSSMCRLSPVPAVQLSGFLLAMILRLEEKRKKELVSA